MPLKHCWGFFDVEGLAFERQGGWPKQEDVLWILIWMTSGELTCWRRLWRIVSFKDSWSDESMDGINNIDDGHLQTYHPIMFEIVIRVSIKNWIHFNLDFNWLKIQVTYKVDLWKHKIRDHDLITSPHTNYRWIIITIEKYEGWTGSSGDLKGEVEGKTQ